VAGIVGIGACLILLPVLEVILCRHLSYVRL
jgi:hypothetical protein